MTKFELAGQDAKDWAMIFLIASLSVTFVIVGVSFFLAVRANPNAITITGSFDISQFIGIVIGISAVALVFVGQRLTAREIRNTVKQVDESWQEPTKPSPGG